MYIKKFDKWNGLKKDLDKKTIEFEIDEREVWWSSIGVNVGEEIDGKHANFERPMLILKKLSKDTVFALPISSTIREGSNFFNSEINNQQSSISLHQGRYMSRKRMLRRVETLMEEKFIEIRNAFCKLFQIERSAFADQSRAPNGEDDVSIATSQNLSSGRSDSFTGTIIEESLEDNRIINQFEIKSMEITGEDEKEKRWHIYNVINVQEKQITELSKNLKDKKYYSHFWNKDFVVVVFKDKYFKYKKGDLSEVQKIIDYGTSLDIPLEQLDFNKHID